MAKKLYVGNLPFSVGDDSLRQLFSQCGAVASARVVTFPDTGRSRGFGFVEMTTDDEAAAAIRTLNGQDLDGRSISVAEANAGEGGRGGGGGGRGPRPGGGGGGRGPRPGGGGGGGGYGGGGRSGGGGRDGGGRDGGGRGGNGGGRRF